MIVVLCGKKRSGKTESSEIIMNADLGFSSFALGDHVKETLEEAAEKSDSIMLRKYVVARKCLREGDRDRTFLVIDNGAVKALFYSGVRILADKGFIDCDMKQKCVEALSKVWDNEELWTPRRLMQVFATDIVCHAIDDSVFVRMAIDRSLRTPNVENILITDCRQPHEYKYLRTLGAKFIFIERDTGMFDKHYSEQGILPSDGDTVIINNGTLAELQENVLNSINEIKK
ncbi:dNMP kinase [Pantoea phage Phynn]|nr:dNMP kinase [Pantoea phage Phynn]